MEENPIFANKNKYGLDKLLCLGNFCFSFGYRQRWRRNKKYFLVIGLFIDPYPVSKLTKTSIQALDFCIANLVERQTLDWMGKIMHMMASNLQIFISAFLTEVNSETFSLYVSSGFTFPVKEFYLEDVLEITGFKFTPKRSNLGPQKPHWHKFTKRGKREKGKLLGFTFLRHVADPDSNSHK